MATLRAALDLSSPSTRFNAYADIVSQNQAGNYSTVNYYLQGINTGNESSFAGDSVTQKVTIGGAGGATRVGSLPSGYSNGQQRWYNGPYSVNRVHDANGNHGTDTVLETVTGNGWNNSASGSLGGYPRIPKRPSPPGKPVASNIMPTSVALAWTASPNNQGSAITAYLLRRWTGTSATGAYVDNSANNLSRTVTGLTPGTYYTFAVYAKNSSADNGGYSNISPTLTIKTIAPIRVKVAGVWKYAVPYVKVSGVWKMAQPYVKVAGVWKFTG